MSQSDEKEPLVGESMEPHSDPPQALCSDQQQIADYLRLFMDEGEELTLSED